MTVDPSGGVVSFTHNDPFEDTESSTINIAE